MTHIWTHFLMKVNSGNNQCRVVRGLFLKSGWMKLLLKGCWEASGSGMLDTGCQWCRCILTCGLVITCYRTILSKGLGPVVIWTRVKYFFILLKAFLQYAQSISLKRNKLGPVAIWTRGGKVNFHPFNRVLSIHPNDAWLGHKETAAQNIIHFNPDHCLWWHIDSCELNLKLSRSNYHSTSLIGSSFNGNFTLYMRHQVCDKQDLKRRVTDGGPKSQRVNCNWWPQGFSLVAVWSEQVFWKESAEIIS